MGVITTADERISDAKEHLLQANKHLLAVLDEDCWGHDDFNEEYMDKIMEVVLEILKLKRKL